MKAKGIEMEFITYSGFLNARKCVFGDGVLNKKLSILFDAISIDTNGIYVFHVVIDTLALDDQRHRAQLNRIAFGCELRHGYIVTIKVF